MLDGENKLILRAVKGESSAFGLLYSHYQPMIYRYIYLKVSQREEAEDLTHQVFLSAWHNIHSYKERGFPFGSWLYQIARNKVIDHYRSRRNDVGLAAIEEIEIAAHDNPSQSLESKIALARVREALLKLKPEYQEIVILRFIEDLPLKQVAEIIGKTEGAVKLLQHRAIKNLKQKIDNGPGLA